MREWWGVKFMGFLTSQPRNTCDINQHSCFRKKEGSKIIATPLLQKHNTFRAYLGTTSLWVMWMIQWKGWLWRHDLATKPGRMSSAHDEQAASLHRLGSAGLPTL
ncbi:hypothetical protein E2C01_019305 [Portunus trituberculatus]|uniref:Uncharacterized protein n=1 Tax=Portunus trituberculatus TaxID=210409 RepID=A0A5B7DWV6_PORTR|nr:hypothetical protein [Portunus trituberculatus]